MALGTQEPHPLPVQVSKEHQQQRLHLQILPQVTPRFSQPLMEKLHSSHLALAVSMPWSAATRARSSGDLAPAMQKKFLLYMLLLRIRKALITIFGGFPLNSQVNLLSKVIPPAPHKRGSQHLPNCRGPPRFVPPDVFQVIFVACSATVKPSCFWCNRIQQISSPRTCMKRDVRSSLIVPSSWHLTDGRKEQVWWWQLRAEINQFIEGKAILYLLSYGFQRSCTGWLYIVNTLRFWMCRLYTCWNGCISEVCRVGHYLAWAHKKLRKRVSQISETYPQTDVEHPS